MLTPPPHPPPPLLPLPFSRGNLACTRDEPDLAKNSTLIGSSHRSARRREQRPIIAQSALDGFDPNANGSVRVWSGNRTAKFFSAVILPRCAPNGGPSVTRNNIARLNADGTLDTGFNPNANGSPLAIALQADGKILVGGVFTIIGGQARNRIARLDPTTGLADSFNPNPNASGVVYSFVVRADGEILVAGDFTSIGGQARNRIARLDPTNGLADSFNPNANALVFTIALQSDGKILAGGNFTTIGGQTRNSIARLDPSTGLADSFDPNANNLVNCFAVQADGKILVGGSFTSIGGQSRSRIARLNPTTGVADSFNPNANGSVVYSIAVQSDGKMVVGGLFTSIGGQTRNNVARLDPVFGLADAFNPNANGFINSSSIVVQPDGKILIGGGFGNVGGLTRNNIARLENDGSVERRSTLPLRTPLLRSLTRLDCRRTEKSLSVARLTPSRAQLALPLHV